MDQISPFQHPALVKEIAALHQAIANEQREKLRGLYLRYKNAASDWERVVWEIPLAVSIFAYEISATHAAAVATADPFLLKLGLKDVAHKVFEFEMMITKTYLLRLKKLGQSVGADVSDERIKALRREFSPAMNIAQTFKGIRDVAGGHFTPDLPLYLKSVEGLELAKVSIATTAVLRFSQSIINMVAEILNAATDSRRSSSAGTGQVARSTACCLCELGHRMRRSIFDRLEQGSIGIAQYLCDRSHGMEPDLGLSRLGLVFTLRNRNRPSANLVLRHDANHNGLHFEPPWKRQSTYGLREEVLQFLAESNL